MGIIERNIQEKIQTISNSYMEFTGRDGSFKQNISISEFNELRKQAVWELEKGIVEVKANVDMPKTIQKEEREEKTTDVKTKPAPTDTENIIKMPEVSNGVIDKFNRLKDL